MIRVENKRLNRTAQLGLALAIAFVATAQAAEDAVLRNGFRIRHESHEVRGQFTRLYLSADRASFVDVVTHDVAAFEEVPPEPITAPPVGELISQQPKPIGQIVQEAGDRHDLDPDLIETVIKYESGGRPKAVSKKGAQGLMQLTPKTAHDLGVKDSFHPESNVQGGSQYLRAMLERYHFDLVKALAAYNAGPEAVDRYHGVPPYRETQNYVARIIREYNRRKLAAMRGHAKEHSPARAQ